MAGSSKRLKQKQKSGSEEADRLSDLPSSILHHVLSFLDTKVMVRTSLLSKRWGSLWKEVPALNFRRLSFFGESNSREYVGKVLSLRSDSAAVSRVTFKFGDDGKRDRMDVEDLFATVMKYAARQGTGGHHHLHELSIWDIYCHLGAFSVFAPSITAHRHHESLKILKLNGFHLDCALGLGFSVLQTLELSECCFGYSESSSGISRDPFADLPSLNRLKLVRCSSASYCLKVSGQELLRLEIRDCYRCRIEVFAPELRCFLFRGELETLAELDLPSLDRASIRVSWEVARRKSQKGDVQRQMDEYIELLCGLHNATSLRLRFDKFGRKWKEDAFPFNSMKSLLELEASPFTRLKILRVQYPQEPPITPYQVIRYFFEGSRNAEEKFIKFEKKIK